MRSQGGEENFTKLEKNKKTDPKGSVFSTAMVSCSLYGGNVWESNPPMQLLTAITGFEDRRAHQRPIRSHIACSLYHRNGQNSSYFIIVKMNFYSLPVNVRASPTFLVIFFLSQYSSRARVYFLELPSRSRTSPREIWPCSLAKSIANFRAVLYTSSW